MKLTKDTKILIVGLGVIGGGYAAALTDAGYEVACITKEKRDIDYALEKKIICYGTTEPDASLIAKSNLIVFALYPTTFIEWVKNYGSLIKSGTLVTDVTGVKSNVVTAVQSMLPSGVEFISAHPMAGRERSGVEFSDKNVFKGANYIVTPTESNTDEAIETCKELGAILGFGKISVLSPEKHDEMIAFLSQLTHCIAVSLMNCNETPHLEKYTGDSFRDLTRIAKINENMWTELFIMNKEALLSEMDAFIDEFKLFRNLVENEDRESLKKKMIASTERRCLFDKE